MPRLRNGHQDTRDAGDRVDEPTFGDTKPSQRCASDMMAG